MMILVAMSMIGIAAVNLAVQDTKVAQNYQSSRVSLIWAEAGIEMARLKLSESEDPSLLGYSCDAAQADSTHYYPADDPVSERRARFCIELIATRQESSISGRGSGQDSAVGSTTYFYKLDSIVWNEGNPDDDHDEYDPGTDIVIRHIQSLESLSRLSI